MDKELLKENDTIYTILRHVSRSSLTREISLFVIKDNVPICLDAYVSKVLGLPLTNRGIKVTGVGMDMGYWLVYELSYAIFKDGYKLRHKWL